MKQLILLICLIINLNEAAWSQTGYSIFKVEGCVKIQSNGHWRSAERRSQVNLRDLLQLAEGSRVGLLEQESGRIYYATTVGTHTIAKLIANARKQSDRHLMEVNNRVAKAITDKDQQGYSYAITGATHRGEGADSQPIAQQTEALYAALRLHLLPEKQSKRGVKVLHDIRLTWQTDSSEETLTPVAANPSSSPLYFTLLRRMSADAAIPYSVATRFGKSSGTPSLFLPAGQMEPIPSYQYVAKGHQPSDWLLIAADFPFDSQLLQQLLQRNAPTKAKPCTLHLAI